MDYIRELEKELSGFPKEWIEEIIMLVICGESVDSAIQKVICR